MTAAALRSLPTPDSQKGTAILNRSGLTAEPCANPQHRGYGFTQALLQADAQGQPQPLFAGRRVLFFRCLKCNQKG